METNINKLIKDEIVKIIESGSYICVSNHGEIDRWTYEKFQAMTNSFDTHLTILTRNHYANETVVSVYPWPVKQGDCFNNESPSGQVTKISIDTLPIPYTFNSRLLPTLLDEMKVYRVPHDLDVLKWISSSSERINSFKEAVVPTAFFKIKHSDGKSFRDCFESIRSVLIGNCLISRAA